MGLLGYASPFGVEQHERREAIRIGGFENPIVDPNESVGAVYGRLYGRVTGARKTYCVIISSGSLSKAVGVVASSGMTMGRFSMDERRPSSGSAVSISQGVARPTLALWLCEEHRETGEAIAIAGG